MTGVLTAVFGLVCGQAAPHTWSPGGVLLPMCERCTGVYVGAASALALHLVLRIRPSVRFLQMHGGFLLLMIPFGYHWVPQDALVRTLCGVVFGAGLVSFLWVIPGPRVGAVLAIGRPQWQRYMTGLVCTLSLVPASAAWGGRPSWSALAGLATMGLAGLGTLVLANLALALMSLRLPRHAASAGRS